MLHVPAHVVPSGFGVLGWTEVHHLSPIEGGAKSIEQTGRRLCRSGIGVVASPFRNGPDRRLPRRLKVDCDEFGACFDPDRFEDGAYPGHPAIDRKIDQASHDTRVG
jgi:hypothetical protein